MKDGILLHLCEYWWEKVVPRGHFTRNGSHKDITFTTELASASRKKSRGVKAALRGINGANQHWLMILDDCEVAYVWCLCMYLSLYTGQLTQARVSEHRRS